MKETFSTTTSLGFSLKHVFTNWFNFSGRAQRGEYWIWILYNMFLSLFLDHILENNMSTEALIILIICGLIIFIGTLSVSVRRGHDIDYSTGASILIAIIPVLSLILAFTPSNPDPNKYGEIQ